MKKLPLVVGGAFLLGTGLLIVTSSEGQTLTPSERVTGLPNSNGLALRPAKDHTEWATSFRVGRIDPDHGLIVTHNGTPILWNGPTSMPYQGAPDQAPTAHELAKAIAAANPVQASAWFALNSAFANRRKTLPPGASTSWDENSKEEYLVPAWLMRPLGATAAAVTDLPVDEFGRVKAGHYGDQAGLWNATLGGLLGNPLFVAALEIGLVALGGPAGVAAIGAYQMWQTRGTELTATNVLLSAARAYAVSQCGETCGVAFDFGVGVAGGKTVDVAAEDALYNQMTPEERVYYEKGKKAVHEVLNA